MFRKMSKAKRALVMVLTVLVVVLCTTVGIGVYYANTILDRISAGADEGNAKSAWEELFEDDAEIEASPLPVPEVIDELPEPEYEEINDDVLGAVEKESEDKIINMLLCGIDSRTLDTDQGRSDAIMIASVNLTDGDVKLISLMRDTEVEIPGYGKQKLAHAASYGNAVLAVQTVNKNFNMDIRHAATVNFYNMAEIIDVVGGVEITVTERERTQLNKNIREVNRLSKTPETDGFLNKSGENILLTGKQAVAFARIRKIDNDFVRTERQRQVLEALLKRTLSEIKNNPLKLGSLVDKISGMVKTTLTKEEILEIATAVMLKNGGRIEQLRLPAQGDYWQGQVNGVFLIRPDWEETQKKLDDFIYADVSVEELLADTDDVQSDTGEPESIEGESDFEADDTNEETHSAGEVVGALESVGSEIKLESGIGAEGSN